MDSLVSHRAFAEKFDLNYPMLSDNDGSLCDAYGVSRARGFPERVTFVIGGDGKITHVIANAKPAEHMERALAAVR